MDLRDGTHPVQIFYPFRDERSAVILEHIVIVTDVLNVVQYHLVFHLPMSNNNDYRTSYDHTFQTA